MIGGNASLKRGRDLSIWHERFRKSYEAVCTTARIVVDSFFEKSGLQEGIIIPTAFPQKRKKG
jgi:hypothetical protein